MAKTIFMIHGMWIGPWCFDKYKAFFEAKGYRVVAPALPYHDVDPKAPPHPQVGTASLQDYADHMQKEIEKLDSPPIIMGHSMGALLTQILAARGLGVAHILLTPAPPWGVFALRWSVIKCFIEGLTRWAFWRKPFRPSCARATYAMLHLIPEAERQSYCGRMVYESGWATAQIGFWAFDFTKGAYVDAAKVTKPMLVIGGGQDRITPAAVVRQVAAKYSPGAEYKEFADMAHLVISEPGWEEVAGYAHDWMKRKGF